MAISPVPSNACPERPQNGNTFYWVGVEPTSMTTRRRQQFVLGQTAWMLGTLLVLLALGLLSLELFFVVSLVGFLVLVEFTAPFDVSPAWRARLKWVILAGLLVFMYIVIKQILETLPPGLV